MSARCPVLVIDDDADLREALCDALRDAGHPVAGASDGCQALKYLQAGERPCAILLDLMMPNMDGFEFRARQLGSPDLCDIPVIVLTAGHPDVREQARLAAPVLHKPFDLEPLIERVDRLCS